MLKIVISLSTSTSRLAPNASNFYSTCSLVMLLVPLVINFLMYWLAPLVSNVSCLVPALIATEIAVSPPALPSERTLTPFDREENSPSLSNLRLSGICPQARSPNSLRHPLLNCNLSFLMRLPVWPVDT